MDDGVVFIAEDFDPEEHSYLTGHFSAHWESVEGPPYRFKDGPEGVPAQEAIEWGRAHAEVVLIRVGEDDTYFSAGTRQPRDDEVPTWPKGGMRLGRRRAPSLAYLDRTPEDPAIMWEVRLAAKLPPGVDGVRFAVRFRQAVANAHDANELGVPHRSDMVGAVPLAVFLVSASTWEEAHSVAESVERRASKQAWSDAEGARAISITSMAVEPADHGV